MIKGGANGDDVLFGGVQGEHAAGGENEAARGGFGYGTERGGTGFGGGAATKGAVFIQAGAEGFTGGGGGLGKRGRGVGGVPVDCGYGVVVGEGEERRGAVEVEDVEPAVSGGREDCEVAGTTEAAVGGFAEGEGAGVLNGEEDAVGAFAHGLFDEAGGGFGDNAQAGFDGFRGDG